MDEISKEVLDRLDSNRFSCTCGFSTSSWSALLAHFIKMRDIPYHEISARTVEYLNTPGSEILSQDGKLIWRNNGRNK